MNARNWILAVGIVVLLHADTSAQQSPPYDVAPYAMPPSAVWAQVSYPQPVSAKANGPRALGASQVFDSPPASEDQSPYVTRGSIITRTAYQSPWSSWTTQEDPEAACGPSCRPPIGPDCNVCEPDAVKSIFGQVYFRAEALALRRSHPPARPVAFDITTGAVVLDDKNLTFPVALGQRFVAGYEFNASNAVEFIFFENQNWKATQLASGANSLFLSGATPTTVADLSANSNDYQGASAMSLINHTSLRNFELNYMKTTTFDKFALLAGYRYVDLHDKLDLSSTFVDFFGNRSTSNYQIDARSRLYGGQLGVVFRQRWDLFTFELVGKGGLYDNFAAQSQVVGDQNNTTTLRNVFRQRKQDLAFVGDVGMNGVFQLSGNLLLRFGYNVLWIDHVALAPNQLDFTDTPASGTGVILKHGNLFMHGVNAGLEARW
jgi:hypothetical protein